MAIKLRKVKGKIFACNQRWETVGGKKHFFRSNWEVRYAKYLEFLKQQNEIEEWEYEPKTFWFDAIKRGTRSYMPDFRVFTKDGGYHWVEVKGHMDQRSRTKLARFARYYPGESLKLVQKDWFDANPLF